MGLRVVFYILLILLLSFLHVTFKVLSKKSEDNLYVTG